MNHVQIDQKYMNQYEEIVLCELQEDNNLMLSHDIAKEETERQMRLDESLEQVRVNDLMKKNKHRVDYSGLITVDRLIQK